MRFVLLCCVKDLRYLVDCFVKECALSGPTSCGRNFGALSALEGVGVMSSIILCLGVFLAFNCGSTMDAEFSANTLSFGLCAQCFINGTSYGFGTTEIGEAAAKRGANIGVRDPEAMEAERFE